MNGRFKFVFVFTSGKVRVDRVGHWGHWQWHGVGKHRQGENRQGGHIQVNKEDIVTQGGHSQGGHGQGRHGRNGHNSQGGHWLWQLGGQGPKS